MKIIPNYSDCPGKLSVWLLSSYCLVIGRYWLLVSGYWCYFFFCFFSKRPTEVEWHDAELYDTIMYDTVLYHLDPLRYGGTS
jgi:hypothetical protein